MASLTALPLLTHAEAITGAPQLAGTLMSPEDQLKVRSAWQSFVEVISPNEATQKKLSQNWWMFHKDEEEDGEDSKKQKEVVELMPPLLTSVMPEDPHHHTLSSFPDPTFMSDGEALRLHLRADEEAAISTAPKKKKNRAEIGTKEYLTMVSGIVYTLALAAIFRKQPLIAVSTVAAASDFVRVGYKSMPAGSRAQSVMRTVAALSLISALVLQLLPPVDPKNPSFLKDYLKALPFTDISFGVFIKGDLKVLKDQIIEGYVSSLQELHLIDPKDKKAYQIKTQVVLSMIQCAIAIGLMNPSVMGPFVSAGAGLWLRTNMREGVNYVWEMIERLDPALRGYVLKGLYISLSVMSAASLYCLTTGLSSNSFVNFILVGMGAVSTDTLMRTFKWDMDILTEPPAEKKKKEKKMKSLTWRETWVDWKENGIAKIKDATHGIWESREAVGKKMAQGTALLGSVVVLSLFLGQVVAGVNPGLGAMIASNMDTPLKPLTKNILTHTGALSMLMPLIGIASLMALLGKFDSQTTAASFAALIMTACFVNLSLYIWKAGLRPPKMEKEKTASVEEVTNPAQVDEKAVKKAEKKDKKRLELAEEGKTVSPDQAKLDKKAAKKAKKAAKKDKAPIEHAEEGKTVSPDQAKLDKKAAKKAQKS
jgi:hypothetical protein